METNEGGSGGGPGETMEKNDQGDEYLKVSLEPTLADSWLMRSYPNTDA